MIKHKTKFIDDVSKESLRRKTDSTGLTLPNQIDVDSVRSGTTLQHSLSETVPKPSTEENTLKMNPIFSAESLEGVDQYEGTASNIWHMYIGDHKARTNSYRQWICNILRTNKCERVLDAATGTGIDSEMLVEEGFRVTSVDNSENMLLKAKELRSKKKLDENFDRWSIYQANWLNLEEDLRKVGELDNSLFDAVILLGNSFSHLLSEDLQCKAIESFRKVLRPGGLLIIDHRNYDVAMNGDRVSQKSCFYNGSNIESVDTYMIAKNGKFIMVILDYFIKVAKTAKSSTETKNFKLFFYPISLAQMTTNLTECFKPSSLETFGDFQPISETKETPSYYCHVVRK